MQNTPDLASVLFGNFITYDRLYHMTMTAFHGQPEGNESSVNIYIDMNSMLGMMYTTIPFQVLDYSVITSSMVNLCAHLRSYFWTRHQVSANIYVVYGDNTPDVSQFVPGYNIKHIMAKQAKSQTKELIDQNIPLMDILFPYINGCYFVHGDGIETASIVYQLICKNENSHTPSIIYTKDRFMYQLVGSLSRTFIFRPKKSYVDDVSWVVTKTNLPQMYRFALGLKDIELPAPWWGISTIMTLSGGSKVRDIPRVFTINKAFAKVNAAYQAGLFNHNDFAVAATSPLYWERFGCMEPDIQQLMMNRFNAMDVNVVAMRDVNNPTVTYHNIVDLYDPDSFRKINDTYFTRYPLDLNRL